MGLSNFGARPLAFVGNWPNWPREGNLMRKLIKLWALLLTLALVAASCGGGDDTTEPAAEETTTEEAAAEETTADSADCASEDVFCVGLITDVGKIDDKSFNQSAWEGVQASVADKFDFVETQDSKDYANNIQTFIDKDYDMIVTVGFAMGEATIVAANSNPDTLFVGVDQFQGETVENLSGLIFPEDKAGFLAGALAGLMTETNTIAAVLGTDLVPPVVSFKEGYEAGAQYTNPNIELISTYHPGGLDVAFTDPAWGAETARQAIDSGADIIFGAGGLTGNGALSEVAKDGGEAFCIGVDSDQWGTVPEAHPCLITSAMKLIDSGVADIIAQSKEGNFPSGNYLGEVGLAPYHDFASTIPEDVQNQIAELTTKVLAGEIQTRNDG